jgi:hypothetical protein
LAGLNCHPNKRWSTFAGEFLSPAAASWNVPRKAGLTYRPLLNRKRTLASGRTTCSAAQGPNVDFQLGDGATQSIAMHSQLARCLTLVSMIFFQHGNDEPLLELAYSLAIEDSAFVHLHHERFQLVLHDAPHFPEIEQFYQRRLLTLVKSPASGCYF